MNKKIVYVLELVLLAAVVIFLFKLGVPVVTTILLFLLILGLLVFVHELGHFWVAKKAGMRVEEFGFGFPPRMFGIKRGETIYSVNWIPLGGFVKIAGEDGGQTQDDKSFSRKGFWARLSVLAAGVTMNVIFAWLLISIAMGLGVPTALNEGESLPKYAKAEAAYVAVNEVGVDSPAEMAGIKVGDKVVSVNGESVESIEELQALTKLNLDKETKYVLARGNDNFEKTIIPRGNPPEGQGALGVSLSLVANVSYPWHSVLYHGFIATWNLLSATVTAFITIIGQWVGGENVSGQLSGPVGIAVLTRDVAELGFIYILQFAAILSVNLAVINAVPFQL